MKISLMAARKNANLTQRQAAERLGTTEQSIAKWEKHNGRIRVDVLYQLMNLYHVNFDDLKLNLR